MRKDNPSAQAGQGKNKNEEQAGHSFPFSL
jgi:hypothetical protein